MGKFFIRMIICKWQTRDYRTILLANRRLLRRLLLRTMEKCAIINHSVLFLRQVKSDIVQQSLSKII